MSDRPDDNPKESAERVVKRNEKFNVPMQTEKEESETFEHAPVEEFADSQEVRRKKEGIE